MKKSDVYLICIILLAMAGGLIMLLSTRWGLGISPDSVTYIQAAQNLASGFGLTTWNAAGYKAMTHFPPLYSMLLAAIKISHIEILTGARWLQALLFSANIASLGLITWLSASGARWLGALAAGLTLAALPMLQIHSWAWSEPLFLLFGMWGMFVLYRHLEKPSWICLLGAAVLVGLACLTRYVGFSLVLAGGSSILLLSRKGFRFRGLDCFMFCLISAIPVATWLARNALVAGNSVNRTIAFHPVSSAKIKSFVAVNSAWLIPQLRADYARLALVIAANVALIAAVALLWHKRSGHYKMRPILFILLFIASYIIALLVSISFLDNAITIDNRMLSPAFAASLLLTACMISAYVYPRTFTRRQVIMTLLGFVIIAGLYAPPAAAWQKKLKNEGLGYASKPWIESRVIDKLSHLTPTPVIYSNTPDPVYLLTGLHALPLPNLYNPNSLIDNPEYQDEMHFLGSVLRKKKGVLVIFNTGTWPPYLPAKEDLLKEFPLLPLFVEDDGTIYTWKDSS